MSFLGKYLPKPQKFFWVLLGCILLLDQATKFLVLRFMQLHESIRVIPHFFDLTYVRNDGVAFGMLRGNNLLTGLLAGCILLGGIIWARKLDWKRTDINLWGALLIGGALGNLIDRIRLGYVVDFLEFYVGRFHWPAFNVADSCISVTITFWILMILFQKPQKDV